MTRSLSRLLVLAARGVVLVVAEVLANTAHHAGPTWARVTFRRERGLLRVAVVDDGSTADWEPRPGLGKGCVGFTSV